MNEQKLDRVEELLANYINPDRLDLIQAIVVKASANNLSLEHFHKDLTIAEICMISIGFGPGVIVDSSIDAVIKYVEMLDLLGVPVTTAIKDFSAAQSKAHEESTDFLTSLNKFRAMWAKANKGLRTGENFI